VVAKYGMATMLLPSLAAGRGDEEDTDAGAGDEATDVWERDLFLVPVEDMSNTMGLRELRDHVVPCSGEQSVFHTALWVGIVGGSARAKSTDRPACLRFLCLTPTAATFSNCP
jgi:hypothetical protein